jgi:hypothetical protein
MVHAASPWLTMMVVYAPRITLKGSTGRGFHWRFVPLALVQLAESRRSLHAAVQPQHLILLVLLHDAPWQWAAQHPEENPGCFA